MRRTRGRKPHRRFRPAAARTLVAIAYDVPNDNRRARMANAILSYGGRIQGSVYEVWLDARQRDELWATLERMAKQDDLVRWYQINACCRSFIRGLHHAQPEEPIAYIV